MGMGSDDGSETASHYDTGSRSVTKSAKRGSANNSISSTNSRKDLKPVAKLRPRRGIRLSESTSIVE
eukprot:scaffold10498_cov246-Chaetoceros_neogracile.AAC.1